ncbi:hypothetical protein GCM10012275_53120 [Longimycelium tulufanense]|uniref:Uncharacterized protein n=1 Tax=Longimycelium tulufanense TaxID=907463 RepID=A0A8J3CD30_9PSEU|nr:hypothetical protein [Longimycelium tulufanense]GGM75777.1 hypothetical protein GCM10012275_53120 [Longimycelium tulufanense]
MGWLTTSKDNPTLRKKARNAVTNKWREKGGAVCLGCDKPLGARDGKANYHPKCAARAVS